MGDRGPVPKRSSERRRRNKDDVTPLAVSGKPTRPPPLPAGCHSIARRWYRSLGSSGQSQFFEPSDWAAALLLVEAISRVLSMERFSAEAFKAVWSAMGDLLTTEAARRRVRLEIERGSSGGASDMDQAVQSLAVAMEELRREG